MPQEWTGCQSNTDEAEEFIHNLYAEPDCWFCKLRGHAPLACAECMCPAPGIAKPQWEARTSNTDEAEELIRTAGVEPAKELNYQAQQRQDARILAENAADWARIAGRCEEGRASAQFAAQTYALASMALSMAYGSDRP